MISTTAQLRRVARQLLAVPLSPVSPSGHRGVHQLRALPLDVPPATPIATKSYVKGNSDIPLKTKTLDQCLEEITHQYPDREALVFSTEGIRKTFSQFKQDVGGWSLVTELIRPMLTICHSTVIIYEMKDPSSLETEV